MILYNAKAGILEGQYVVTKFDDDMNIESTYTTSLIECDCPAGVRPTCRHRQMLPFFIAQDYVDSNWFFCYDDQTWHLPFIELSDDDELAEVEDQEAEQHFLDGLKSIPGVTVMTMGDPIALHNTIADAVGEPEAKLGTEASVASPSVPPGEVPAVVTSPGPITTIEQDELSGHASREDREAYDACAANRATPVAPGQFKRRV